MFNELQDLNWTTQESPANLAPGASGLEQWDGLLPCALLSAVTSLKNLLSNWTKKISPYQYVMNQCIRETHPCRGRRVPPRRFVATPELQAALQGGLPERSRGPQAVTPGAASFGGAHGGPWSWENPRRGPVWARGPECRENPGERDRERPCFRCELGLGFPGGGTTSAVRIPLWAIRPPPLPLLFMTSNVTYGQVPSLPTSTKTPATAWARTLSRGYRNHPPLRQLLPAREEGDESWGSPREGGSGRGH